MGDSLLPPVAARRPHTFEAHGHTRTDDYYWMRERDSADVLEYLTAENEFTDAGLRHTEAAQSVLYNQTISRIQETDSSAPVFWEGWWYYHRTEQGLQYPIFCRRLGSMQADEHIFFDQNVAAAEHGYHELGALAVSPDQRLLAFSEDTEGNESHVLRVRNLESGELLPDTLTGLSSGLAWANDSKSFFYVLHDEAMRAYKVMHHVLGADTDTLIHEESDQIFSVGVSTQRSRRAISLHIGSAITSEEWLIDPDDPLAPKRLVAPRKTGVEYVTAHHGDVLFVRIKDETANNFKVMKADFNDLERAWEPFIDARENVKVESLDIYAGHLVMEERAEGLVQLRIRNLTSNSDSYVDCDDPVYSAGVIGLPTFESTVLRYSYESMTTPRTTYDLDMNTSERTLVKRQPVLGDYNPDDYESQRLWAEASDGVRIPISIVYRKDSLGSLPAPALLYGYGSYGFTIDPYFSIQRLTLLDRGMIFALAHPRGGGDLGEPWHDDGKMLTKTNTFTDFVACAEHLIAEGFTTADSLAIQGGSAGGLLIGAVINMRPDLFAAAVAEVPFVDVVTTMSDEAIPLTAGEWEEWGNPADEQYYRYMLSYSPYDNVGPHDYPALLVMTGLNDPRVQYWEPAKWVAKLRTVAAGSRPVYLRTNMGAGHGGPSGRYDLIREGSFINAFILDRLGRLRS